MRKMILMLACFLFANPMFAEENLYERKVRPLLQSHCFQCHGDETGEAGINFAAITTEKQFLADAELIEAVIEAIDSQAMPPEDERSFASSERTSILQHLNELLHLAIARNAKPPQTPIRRMNRFQYNNAVQDLFDLNCVVFTLPERMLRDYNYFKPQTGKMPDNVRAGNRPLGKSQMIEPRLEGVSTFPQDLRAENGFDNRADHLSLSPMLMESFLKLSRSIVNSPDFHEKSVGIWDEFFRPPGDREQIAAEIPKRLRKFLSLAFRKPVSDEVVERYSQFVFAELEGGNSFTEAMKLVASAAIASPNFLYLYDRASQPETVERIDDFELATRLSFFFWGSIPDQQLLDLASENELSKPVVLNAQIDRMMNDVRMKRFCDSFPTQWLQLDRIISSVPDPETYPEFYFAKYRVSMHMVLEPLLVFETILIENRSILEMIDAPFSYRSPLLEAWYNNPDALPRKRNVQTQQKKVGTPPVVIPFKRYTIEDRRQGGLITNAAVMTMTSNPTRTQPITRGAWLATVIFNTPPEPPPANVPPLAEEKASDENLTIRERFAAHRENPSCAGCHVKIDPLGFALENYGPTGFWRDEYENGREVNPDGELFRQHQFTNIVEFKDALLAEQDRFAKALAKHLLSFALGREVASADTMAIDQIVAQTKAARFQFRDMLKFVVLSEPFQQKYSPSAGRPTEATQK